MRKSLIWFFLGIFSVVVIGAGYNGSGTFVRTHNWTSDKNAGIKIDSARMDAEDDGFATGLSTAITKDGQTTITANIPFNNKKITGLASGTARTDSLNVGNVQDGGFVWGGTAGGTADVITFNLSPVITAYATGMQVAFLSSGANTTNVTVNINAVGAVAITKNGTTALAAGDIPSGVIVFMVYDGTRFQIVGQKLVTATATAEGLVELATQAEVNTGTDTARSLTPATLKSHLTTPNPIGQTTPAAIKGTTLEGTTSLKLATGATVTGIEDSDTLASDSATLLATQQSIKAYVDAAAVSYKIGSFSRDVSTATGTQAVTGVGFQPRLLVLLSNLGSSPATGASFTDGTNHGLIYNQHAFSANSWANSSTNIVTIEQGSGNQYNGALSSLDSDGFTISWTKTGSPTGTATIYFLALS